jgi:glycosyltransferase involved in cell wall biosynthesis
MDVSIVIPTYNNREVLRQTIRSLQEQTFAHEAYEIVIADDGSTDGTAEMIGALQGPVPVRYVAQPKSSRAAVRNLGARAARGRILLFLDSDVWATPTLLAEHCKHHASTRRVGVQGRSPTHPEARSTLFMRVKEMGPDLTLRRSDNLSPFHVTTRNLSLPRADFEAAGGFDEGFHGYGWEDMELALRLRARGVIFEYEPGALGYHYHVDTLDANISRLRQAGEGAVYFWRKHGRPRALGLFLEIAPAMLPLKWLVYRTPLLTPLVRWLLPRAEAREWRPVLSECYNHLIWRSYYAGVFDALHGRGAGGTVTHPRPDAQRGPAGTA